MKKFILIPVLLSVLCSCGGQRTQTLPRAAAEDVKADVSRFDRVFDQVYASGTNQIHSIMVVQDGKVIYERWNTGYSPDQLHVMWSVTKTFTATAVGFARQDGLLDVTDKVKDFFDASELPADTTGFMDKLTIHHLLTMSSGLRSYSFGVRGTLETDDLDEAALGSGFDFEPGSRFRYNSYDSYLLSAIVSRVTGKKLSEYLEEKLFRPLGIDEFHYLESPEGYNYGGWGLYLTTESLTKMGLFMLQKGMWNGKRLLDEEWFDMAMNEQIQQDKGKGLPEEEIASLRKRSDWNNGYCYQMWKCKKGDSVRLDGAYGQFSIIIRDKNAVVTVLEYTGSADKSLDSVWENIYDAL